MIPQGKLSIKRVDFLFLSNLVKTHIILDHLNTTISKKAYIKYRKERNPQVQKLVALTHNDCVKKVDVPVEYL